MKRILLSILVIGVLLLSACSASTVTPTTPGSEIENIIHQELGSCNREGVDKISDLEISGSPETSYIVTLTFSIDDNLTEGMIKGGAQMDVFNLMKALYQSSYEMDVINIFGTFSMQDRYGNVTEETVLKCQLTHATGEKINWNNMLWDHFFEVLDSVWWHPVFQRVS